MKVLARDLGLNSLSVLLTLTFGIFIFYSAVLCLLLTFSNSIIIYSIFIFQVLDLGFNLIRILPPSAFKQTKDLTLLALDGNPMAYIPEESLSHLNKSLRGLSLGGRFLTCDCKMRWITEWIQNFDLQVTSRERNPQFCGNPQHLRDRNFYQLNARGMLNIYGMQKKEFSCLILLLFLKKTTVIRNAKSTEENCP